MTLDKKTFKKLAALILIGVAGSWALKNYDIFFGILGKTWGLFFPFILGLVIAFILNIPMKAIEKYIFRGKGGKLKRPFSFILALLFVLLLVFFLIFMVGPQLVKAIQQLIQSMPGYWSRFQKSLEPYEKYIPQIQNSIESFNVDWKSMLTKTFSFLQNGAGNVFNSAVGVASSIISGTVSFFIGFIFSVYVLLDKEHIGAQFDGILLAYLPEKIYHGFKDFASLCNHMFTKFVTGQCTEGLAIGAIFTVVLFIGGFDYALLIGVLIGFMSLIPVFGTTIACIISALLLLMSQGFGRALIFVILFLIIQQLDGNFMYPHIVGTSVGLPAMWVMAAVIVGGSLMGIVGMFICIPVASIIYTLIHQNALKRLEKKGIASPVAVLNASSPPPKPHNKSRKKARSKKSK